MAAQLFPLIAAVGGCTSTSQQITGPAPASKCSISVTTSAGDFGAQGGDGKVTVTTERDCSWKAATDATWVAFTTPAEMQGNGTVSFTVAPTTDPVTRTASLSVADQKVAITQRAAACRYQLSAQQVSLPAPGGGSAVDVSASSALCEWSAQADASWLSIPSGSSYKGSARVTFQAPPWNGPERRSDVRIADQHLALTQSGTCTFTLASTSAAVPAAGGSASVAVQAGPGCTWTIANSAAWVSVATAASNSGAATVEFTVASNSGPARSTTVAVANQSFTINQASGCQYQLNPLAGTFASAGGSGSIAVNSTAGCDWTADSDADWLTMASARAGSGAGSVQINVAANTGPQRTGNVRIANQRFVATQASGCQFQLNPTAWTFATAGGPGSISVSTVPGCDWTAGSDADWLAITSSRTGSGPGTVQINVIANGGPQRSANVQIANQRFVATQASGCQYQLNPTAWTFATAGGPGTIGVSTVPGCDWTAGSDADWLTITASRTGSGPGTVQINVTANGGPQRTANVQIGNQRFVATQLTGCAYSIEPKGWGFPAAGAADWVWVTATPGCYWVATSQANWLSITSGAAGYGSAITYYVVAPNYGPPRQGTLTIAGLVFTVTQAAAASAR